MSDTATEFTANPLEANRAHAHLLAEADLLIDVIADGLDTTRTLCVAAATITFAVVGLTGALLGASHAIEPMYAWLSSGAVVCGAVAAAVGLSALHFYSDAATQAKYLRAQFDYGEREQIENAKKVTRKRPEAILELGRGSVDFGVHDIERHRRALCLS